MADEKKSREVGELTVKVAADVGEALTGFKALQRELRETTKAAREMEQAYEDVEKAIAPNTIDISTKETEASFFDLSEVSTKELSEELAKREGVTGYYVGPHGEHAVIKFYDEHGNIRSIDVNGARILVNID